MYSTKLRALFLLKSLNLIDKATDAKYLGYTDGDHYFSFRDGDLSDVCSVDVITRTVKSSGMVALRDIKRS